MEQLLQIPAFDIVLVIAVIAVLLVIFLLTRRPPQVHVGKSRIDKRDAASVLEVFSADTKFFDFRIRSYTSRAVVLLHPCPDGTWGEPVPLASFAELEPGQYRLILRCVGSVIDTYLCCNADYDRVIHMTSAVPADVLQGLDACASVGQYELSDGKVSVGADKPFPLWALLGSHTVAVSIPQEYQEAACDAGFAILLQFA